MAIKRTEAMIQRACMDWLATQDGLYFFRANSGAFKTAQGRYIKTGRPGCPDIVVCLTCCCMDGKKVGVFVGLEVKTATGKQSQSQKKASFDIQNAGGFYYIVRSVSDAKRAIEQTRQEMLVV